MHSSLAFRILRNNHNFLSDMSLSQFLKFHALVVDLILCTDMVGLTASVILICKGKACTSNW